MRGQPAAGAQAQAGFGRDHVAHRPRSRGRVTWQRGREREPVRGRERVEAHVAPPHGQRAHQRRRVHGRVEGEVAVEQDVVAGEAEQRRVGREPEGLVLADGDAAVRVGAHDPRRRPPRQHLVPTRERVGRRGPALQHRVLVVEGIEGERARQLPPRGAPPFGVPVHDLHPPGTRQVPARPAEVGPRGRGMGGESDAAEVAHVVEGVARVAGEAEHGIRDAEAQHVARRGRDLGADQHQHAVVVALPLLGLEVVVVGDDDEPQPGLARGRDHLLGRGRSVRQRGVDVHDARHADVTVARQLADQRQRPPARDTERGQAETKRDDEDEDAEGASARHVRAGPGATS